MQSFDERYTTALTRWNTALAAAAHGMQFVETADLRTAEVVVSYRTGALSTDRSYIARADVRLRLTPTPPTEFDTARCPLQVDDVDAFPQAFNLGSAEVLIQSRNDWFTMRDDMRSTWERCGSDQSFALNVSNLYLCSRLYDFGSVMTHELGHILGLHHPQVAAAVAPTAPNEAGCMPPRSSSIFQATMCQTTYPHRTEQRTLDAWDVNSIVQHQNVHA